MNKTAQTWAEIVRSLRAESGLTVKEFAKHYFRALSHRTIEDWEQGRKAPPEWVQYLVWGQAAHMNLRAKKKKTA